MIEYCKTDHQMSVVDLIAKMNDIVGSNPHIDFDKIGVALNSGEYAACDVQFTSWECKGKTRYDVDIY